MDQQEYLLYQRFKEIDDRLDKIEEALSKLLFGRGIESEEERDD
jgi:hypothetical protein